MIDIHAGVIHTHHGDIPNFAAAHTLHSAKSGDWHEASTWDAGRVPEPTDVVVIKNGHSIRFSGVTEVDILGVAGELVCVDSSVSDLKVGILQIYEEGSVQIGTEATPYNGYFDLVISNKPLDLTADPEQYGTGILGLGKFTSYGQPKTPWLKVSDEMLAGDTTIVLSENPVGWLPGDRLVIPDSNQYPIVYRSSTLPDVHIPLKIEVVEIKSIAGSVVTLVDPLVNDHLGFYDEDGTVFGMPHVGNLTRNITVRSENPSGIRAHSLFTGRADVKIHNTCFFGMGRTTSNPLNNSNNKIGRYPIHFHHLMGPVNPTNTGYQFRFDGNVVEDCQKWGVGIHNSHWGTCNDNVIYKATGAGIVTEQGNERGNEIKRNFCVHMGNPITSRYNPMYGGVRDNQITDIAWEGSGLWFAGMDNIVIGNVSANCAFAGINYNGKANGAGVPTPVVPRFRGADHAVPADWDDHRWSRPAPPVLESRDNETYSSDVCHWVGFCGGAGLFKNIRGWNLRGLSIYSARNAWAEYEGLHLRSNSEVTKLNAYANIGIDIAGKYPAGHNKFRSVSIVGFNVGIRLPENLDKPSPTLWPGGFPNKTIFDDVFLKNNVNVIERAPSTAKHTEMTGVTWALNPWGSTRPGGMPPTPMHIIRELDGAVATLPSTLTIEFKDGRRLEYFMPEQANVATCTGTDPLIQGFVCYENDIPPPPPPPPVDDLEFSMGGRKYIIHDVGISPTEDNIIIISGVKYTITKVN